MCRFSASLAPPPAPETDALESLLQDDSFNWFDAIDDIDDGLVQAAFQSQAQESDSTRDGSSSGPSSGSAAVGGSDSSSYDLVEMFKQQVEQQVPVPVQAPVVQGFQLPQMVAPIAVPFAALPQQQMMCGVAGPFAGACMAPAFLPAGMPGAAAPAVLNNTVCTPTAPMTGVESATPSSSMPCTTGSGMLTSSCGRRGSRCQKTQEEIDAAVERIKQKRRESAQRSRARKNDYMRQLELENQALKDEVQRLQQVLGAVQRNAFQQQQAAAMVQLAPVQMC